MEGSAPVFSRRLCDDASALVFERQLHARAVSFVVFNGGDARSHYRKPRGRRPPLRGSGRSGWALPARALAVGGEERVPPGTLAGAVVEAPGQVTADLPTAHQRRNAALGPDRKSTRLNSSH